MYIIKICFTCGKSFSASNSAKARVRKYCSLLCANSPSVVRNRKLGAQKTSVKILSLLRDPAHVEKYRAAHFHLRKYKD